VAILAFAAVGLGLNLRAWILLGPHLAARSDVRPGEYDLLMGLPLLIAAVARLPVGVLTDRYGARVMFPAVSLAAAGAAFALGFAGSLPAVAVAGGAAGIAGTAYVVGTTLVAKTFGYGLRGRALGVFTLGSVVAVLISAASWTIDPGGRWAAVLLGAALVAFAALAALVLRDDIAIRHRDPWLRRCRTMIRLASGTSLSLLYALALGGVVAIAVYLPAYLTGVFDIGWFRALAVTGGIVVVAAFARLAGGWWSDRRPTARLLVGCYGAGAALCLVVALAPRVWWLTVPVIAALAVCDGLASGALLALIGKAARTDSAGSVMGVTGAASAFGALLLSLLLVGVDRLSHSYAAAWIMLGAVLLAVALYVHGNGLRVGLGLALRFEPEPAPTAMTVAVVGESDTRLGAAAVVARLAELAASDELVVIYGSDEPARPRLNANVLVTGLRHRLPRHSVVAVRVGLRTGALDRDAAMFDEFVESGAVTIAVTPSDDLRGVAAQLSSYLRADRVLKVSYSLAAGAEAHQVWERDRRRLAE
jgi:NNP family nitrate/nitrite transporter-like MFS transporter